MNDSAPVERFLQLAVRELGFHTSAHARSYINRFLGGLDIPGKAVLDIGCGKGLMALYCACRGASPVVGLEPEEAGSSAHSIAAFNKLASALKLPDTVCLSQTLQEYDPGRRRFDLILMHSSINHLDEEACIELKDNPAARQKYIAIFRKLNGLTVPGGKMVIIDCSRYNLFGMLGIKNPLSPTIEWHKHQSPRLWASLLKESGFINPRVNWPVHARLRPLESLLANPCASFFMRSSFRLVVQKA